MSKENVQKFYAFIKENEAAKAKVLEAKDTDSIVELAKAQGFEFTQEEHDEYLTGLEGTLGEVEDDQLDGIAGGIGLPGAGKLPGSGTLPGSGSGILPGNPTKTYNVYCPKCGKGFDTMKDLTRHGLLVHSGII